MKNTYQTAKRMAKNTTLVGLAVLTLGGCSNSIDKAIESDAKKALARNYTSQVLRDMGFKQYGQRNGARVATKDYLDGSSSTLIDANGNGYFEKRLEFVPGQEPRLEVDSNDGAVFGFPQ